MDVGIATQWAAFGGAMIVIMTGLARLMSITKNANKAGDANQQANTDLIVGMRAEIKRLENIIDRLNKRIGQLENNINALRNLEIHNATDFGALETVMETVPCILCPNQGEAYKQLRIIVDRMKIRRKKRQTIIEEPANVDV